MGRRLHRRRLAQILSLGLLHSSWGPELKWFCNPVLSCHSCALSWFACPIGVFTQYSGCHVFPTFAVGTILLLGVLVGRLLCGWACPFGLVQDLLYRLPTPKITLPAWTSHVKYLVLLGPVILLPFWLGESTWFSFCRICPASALQVTLPNLISAGGGTVGIGTAVKLGALAAVLVLAVLSTRSFCKVLCPIGAMLAPLNLVCFWAVQAPTADCTACGSCDRVCPEQGSPASRHAAAVAANRSLDCIACHDCVEACPSGRDRGRGGPR
ncbi:MAG: 4Fe-4S binding protein [Candidatus Riflebacteria bacterium]|nr:4Fe-4S binding protein [Candidatus Riflebacteria bacterium]